MKRCFCFIGSLEIYYDTVVPDTPFKSDALWGVNTLRALGYKIVIITGRTKAFYIDPYKTTIEELENGKIVYDKLICTLDKSQACIDEKISVLIDDMPANCESAVSIGIPALLFESKANREIETECIRVKNWAEAVEAVKQIARGYPNRENAERLLKEAEAINPGPWGNHCRVAAKCAEKIAMACSMDVEKAYVLGLLHDIGRRFLIRDLGHLYYGYQYMKRLGYHQVARVCLSHSFPNQNLQIYIGKTDIPKEEVSMVEKLLGEMQFDDYDRLIQLCDALAGGSIFLP